MLYELASYIFPVIPEVKPEAPGGNPGLRAGNTRFDSILPKKNHENCSTQYSHIQLHRSISNVIKVKLEFFLPAEVFSSVDLR